MRNQRPAASHSSTVAQWLLAALAAATTAAVLLLSSTVDAALSPAQMQQLQTFYAATGGPTWIRQDGWTVGPSLWRDPCNATDPQPRLFGISCLNGGIQDINLQGNGLAGTIPSGFFLAFPSVQTVQLLNNPRLGGSLPEFPANSELQALLVSSCNFTGSIPASIFTGPLQQLQLQLNRLTGGLPDAVGNSALLSILNVGGNALTIGTLTNATLKCVNLQQLVLIASGVQALPNLSVLAHSLQQLNLQQNSLTGSIPTDWCALKALTGLYLQGNSGLSGSLPDCIANWTQLETLIIENTQMEGTIPTFVFTTFNQLTALYLSGSRFSGTIPDLFHLVPNLEHVELNGNNIAGDPVYSGPFPDSLLGLSNLQTISIQYTNVQGPKRSFASLAQIQSITLASNPLMAMPFPGEVLTTLWAVPGAAAREIILSNMPVSGTLPQIPDVVYNMSTIGGIGFASTDITGYIPNRTLAWVPPNSRQGLLADCKQLLYPVAPWMLELTDNFHGVQYTLSGIHDAVADPMIYSMGGGTRIGIAGTAYANIDGRFFCGFCVSGNATACEGDVQSMPAPERQAHLSFTSANQSTPGVTFCVTPTVTANRTIPVYLFYVGPAYGPDTEYYRVSSNSVSVGFYNPTPTLTALVPNQGRIEGCTTVYAVGSGFFNAPNVTLSIGGSVWADGGVVLNDTTVKFVIPSANASSINAKYRVYSDVPLSVDLYPAADLQFSAVSSAQYQFVATCTTPLVPCANGFDDDQNCPVQPLCRCFAEGLCAIPNGTTSYQCTCNPGFGGHGCSQCLPDYYGPGCSRCDCDHGVCEDGMQRDGSCVCDAAYFGKTCSVSKWGVGIGVPVGVAVVAVVALVVRKRLIDRMHDDGDFGLPMNALSDKQANAATKRT